MTTRFWLRPLEALYFGPPSSIPAGDIHHGKTMFPPSPRTFQGMVRTRLLHAASLTHQLDDRGAAAKQERARLVGPPDSLPDGWQIEGPYPIDCKRPIPVLWVSTPRFLLREKRAYTRQPPMRARALVDTGESLSDLSARMENPVLVGAPECGEVRPIAGWISTQNLRWALTGAGTWDPEGHGSDLPPFVQRETRTGVSIEPGSGSARAGRLYSLGMVRFAYKSGFYGRLTLPQSVPLQPGALMEGTVPAGRGGRQVAFECLAEEDPDWAALCKGEHLLNELTHEAPTRIWLVCTSPVHMVDPVKPLLHAHPQVRIRAALLGKPLTMGGFSIEKGEKGSFRDNRLYVPAGSAWLAEVDGPDRAETIRELNNSHPFCATGDPESRFGFGHVLVGLVSP